jgi:hypothetical protein
MARKAAYSLWRPAICLASALNCRSRAETPSAVARTQGDAVEDPSCNVCASSPALARVQEVALDAAASDARVKTPAFAALQLEPIKAASRDWSTKA